MLECNTCKNVELNIDEEWNDGMGMGWTDCKLLSMIDLECEGEEFLAESMCLFYKAHCGKCGGDCANRG